MHVSLVSIRGCLSLLPQHKLSSPFNCCTPMFGHLQLQAIPALHIILLYWMILLTMYGLFPCATSLTFYRCYSLFMLLFRHNFNDLSWRCKLTMVGNLIIMPYGRSLLRMASFFASLVFTHQHKMGRLSVCCVLSTTVFVHFSSMPPCPHPSGLRLSPQQPTSLIADRAPPLCQHHTSFSLVCRSPMSTSGFLGVCAS
jgi:hypothetical protein